MTMITRPIGSLFSKLRLALGKASSRYNDDDHWSNRLSVLKASTCPGHWPGSILCLANCWRHTRRMSLCLLRETVMCHAHVEKYSGGTVCFCCAFVLEHNGRVDHLVQELFLCVFWILWMAATVSLRDQRTFTALSMKRVCGIATVLSIDRKWVPVSIMQLEYSALSVAQLGAHHSVNGRNLNLKHLYCSLLHLDFRNWLLHAHSDDNQLVDEPDLRRQRCLLSSVEHVELAQSAQHDHRSPCGCTATAEMSMSLPYPATAEPPKSGALPGPLVPVAAQSLVMSTTSSTGGLLACVRSSPESCRLVVKKQQFQSCACR